MNAKTLMVIAGVAFGLWPLIMQKSGLNGNVQSFFFGGIALVLISAFAIGDLKVAMSQINWTPTIIAGIVGGIGMLCFNEGLAKTPVEMLGQMFVLMIVVQTLVPAVFHVWANGGLDLSKGVGFVFAIVAAVLLTR
jgi:hypothetical protein